MKILIADDDSTSRTLLVDILSSASGGGYELIAVEDGAKAWKALESNPDAKVAIVDLAMPEVTGVEWIRRVRGDPRFAALPIIVCTGNTDRSTVASVAALGISNYLVKPFTRTTVLEKVWAICKPNSATVAPVLRDLGAARQRFEIDRDTHRELLGHYVRVADLWAADARRAADFPRVRALGIRAGHLKQMFTGLGAALMGARMQEAEEALAPYRVKPLTAEMPACLRKTQQLGEIIQQELDRLRQALDTIA